MGAAAAAVAVAAAACAANRNRGAVKTTACVRARITRIGFVFASFRTAASSHACDADHCRSAHLSVSRLAAQVQARADKCRS